MPRKKVKRGNSKNPTKQIKVKNGKWIPARAVKIVTKAGKKFLHILT